MLCIRSHRQRQDLHDVGIRCRPQQSRPRFPVSRRAVSDSAGAICRHCGPCRPATFILTQAQKSEIFMSILEIYNESLRDLTTDADNQLDIRTDAQSNVKVEGLLEHAIAGPEEVSSQGKCAVDSPGCANFRRCKQPAVISRDEHERAEQSLSFAHPHSTSSRRYELGPGSTSCAFVTFSGAATLKQAISDRSCGQRGHVEEWCRGCAQD